MSEEILTPRNTVPSAIRGADEELVKRLEAAARDEKDCRWLAARRLEALQAEVGRVTFAGIEKANEITTEIGNDERHTAGERAGARMVGAQLRKILSASQLPPLGKGVEKVCPTCNHPWSEHGGFNAVCPTPSVSMGKPSEGDRITADTLYDIAHREGLGGAAAINEIADILALMRRSMSSPTHSVSVEELARVIFDAVDHGALVGVRWGEEEPATFECVRERYRRGASAVLSHLRSAQTIPGEDGRSCTCHPDDNPPVPCPRKFAHSECVDAAQSRIGSPIGCADEGGE